MDDQAPAKSRRQPSATVPYVAFEGGMRLLSMSAPELCKALGFSEYAYSNWREKGMPMTAALAIDGLVAIQSASKSAPLLLLVKCADPAQATTVEGVVKAMGCQVIMVPL